MTRAALDKRRLGIRAALRRQGRLAFFPSARPVRAGRVGALYVALERAVRLSEGTPKTPEQGTR